jgi:N-methylhydantoinase B
VSGYPLAVGDLVIMETSGGGGYGDPLDRDPAKVALDVAEGTISRAVADSAYGVVFDGDGPDETATRERRDALRGARVGVELHPTDTVDETRVSGIVLSRPMAERLGARVGAVVELVDPGGAPLRLWVSAIVDDGDGRAFVSVATLQMAGLAAGARVQIRTLVPSLA